MKLKITIFDIETILNISISIELRHISPKNSQHNYGD
jgi:hypothetical protein